MISVCIATYNGEKYIQEQLLSILPQLGPEDEVIVSDDASADRTIQIIEDLHDQRIHILHHTPYTAHHFPADATTHNFEHAIMNCHGDYIFLADQDDVWLPSKVQITMQALQSADLVVHDCQIVSSDLQTILQPSYFAHIHVHTQALLNAIKCTYLGCCLAFNKKILKDILPFPPTCAAHDQWIGIVAALRYKTKLIHQPLILYRRHLHTQTQCGYKSTFRLWFQIQYKAVVIYYTVKKWLFK